MVFRFVDPDLSIVAHIPFEYRCHEHRLVFLEESFRAEDLERLRKNMIRLLGSELPGYRLGKKAQIFAVFIPLNERQVLAAIRVAQQNGMLVFEPDPLPVEYVGLEDMPDPTPGVSRS